ncbi:MAG: DNA-binding response regulator [Acidobacteria bacterium]|nr:MAG: DNA-binding response regulator [Acidobacteriota bacterium]
METTVVIVDDFPLARAGIAAALGADPGISVIGEAGAAAEAIERVRELGPDVVLLDLRLGDGGGPELVGALLAAAPAAAVLVLTAIEKVGTMREVREAGAAGCLSKRIAARDLRGAVLTVAGGGTAFDPGEPAGGPPEAASEGTPEVAELLTARQLEVLALVAEGASDAEVAARLSLSPRTVQSHLAAIRARTGMRRRPQLASWAVKHAP